ncbi:PREDICTED: uncharacterized protein LOC107330485 [Acropora digitifera]|uniref:uncharacterized protein LOC107330485 n=1 Tax=Acropora digitifera TaxID=70779 RepID=UPI00077AE67E|nr:PREDICTED: uncharacterized protein LOC107330485 [Acropora digitifera]XP_015750577.1 PREDICTED: uncharacterized protein LOC107330485 [Acropora digitifera]XP_015750578.1 PREDICTED: uncharacterized protein LOC107330485 [Acropora digitifera]XP_015750579.1 PREDICTED: uncharacterized protein LOC107330485 [Acropora digitifera]XP_015750580.1 PREDICTED: uncharacterized protein LOC107330485 [Acropora digitifera]
MLPPNSPREQLSLSLGQNTIQTIESVPARVPLNGHPSGEIFDPTFSPLIFMTEKVSEWVEMYDWNELNNSLKASFKYDGFSQSGFHLFTLTPRPLLELKNTQNRSLHFLPPWKSYMVLDHLSRYIPSVISRTVQDDRFVLVIQDIYSMSGCSEMCFQLVKSVCKSLQERFGEKFERAVIYKPAGLLTRELSNHKLRNLPYSRMCLGFFRTFDIVVVDERTSKEFAKATGFPKRFFSAADNDTWSKYVDELFDFLPKLC